MGDDLAFLFDFDLFPFFLFLFLELGFFLFLVCLNSRNGGGCNLWRG